MAMIVKEDSEEICCRQLWYTAGCLSWRTSELELADFHDGYAGVLPEVQNLNTPVGDVFLTK